MMKAFHIKHWRDAVMVSAFLLLSLSLILGVPTLITWVSWNALVGDVMNGPYIVFWQAVILTLAFYVLLYLVLRPEIHFELTQVDDSNNNDDPTHHLPKKPNKP
jgi:hypothetical protein